MDPKVAVFTLLLIVLFSHGSVFGVAAMENDNIQNTLIERLDDIQIQLAEVTKSIRSLDGDISKALLSCQGMNSDLCEASNKEDKAEGNLRLRFAFRKRRAPEDPELERYRSLFQELGRKQAMVNHLLGVFKGANNVLKNERKRTCNLNLGFHCQAEEISDFADQYDFLSGPDSPGKKRSVRSAR